MCERASATALHTLHAQAGKQTNEPTKRPYTTFTSTGKIHPLPTTTKNPTTSTPRTSLPPYTHPVKSSPSSTPHFYSTATLNAPLQSDIHGLRWLIRSPRRKAHNVDRVDLRLPSKRWWFVSVTQSIN